jgi:hypothetical protein
MPVTPVRKKWTGTMTDRERFTRQMACKGVDRCFNMEFGYWDECYTQWPLFVENHVKDNDVDCDLFFNFDRIAVVEGLYWMHPYFPNEIVGETQDTVLMRTKNGVIEECTKDGHASIPRAIRATVATPDDWNRIKDERFRRDDPARRFDITALKRKHPDSRDYPLGIHCGSMIGKIRDMLTFDGLCYAIYDCPDMVEDMVETCCQLAEDILDQLLPHFTFDHASGWEDICYKNGPIVSPSFVREVLLPRYKRIHAKLRKAGVNLWYTDCDGDVRQILPLLLEAGINCLFPHEVSCSGHPGELLRQYGGELKIMGGFDKTVLTRGRDQIKSYMQSLVPWVEKGGFIPFVDHRVPVNVSPDDYLYYLDLKESMFGMK